MTRYGYFLASEEHGPQVLVRQAKLAEEAGFDALWISDHFHLAGRAGAERLRVVDDRRDLAGYLAAHHNCGDQPAATPASRDRRAGHGHLVTAHRRRLHARRRKRGGAERAHPRRAVAVGRAAPRDARGSRRRAIARGRYGVSVACAEHGLWPAVRDADPGTAILADGFSCRTQIKAGHLGREGMHLAELLAGILGDPTQRDHQGERARNGG